MIKPNVMKARGCDEHHPCVKCVYFREVDLEGVVGFCRVVDKFVFDDDTCSCFVRCLIRK